jgi:hypothetical protein
VAAARKRARARLGIVLCLLEPRRHLHGAGYEDCSGVCDTDGRAHHLITPCAATARAGPSAYTINTGTEAQASSCQSVAS